MTAAVFLAIPTTQLEWLFSNLVDRYAVSLDVLVYPSDYSNMAGGAPSPSDYGGIDRSGI